MKRQRESSAVVAGVLIVALLLGGLPQLSGVIIAGGADAPAFTLDICHPLPGLNQGSGLSAVPLTNGRPSVEKLASCGTAPELQTPAVTRASEAPDPPPPKSLG